MGLELSIVGRESSRTTMSYDPKTVALYALGVGAKKAELDFLYEHAAGGMKVLPTFAVVPAFAPVMSLLAASGGDMAMVVHGAQKVRLFGAIPAEGTLATVARAEGLYDLKKFAQLILTTTTHLVGEGGAEGPKLFETTWSIIFRNAGGFGGPRPPENDSPSVPRDRAPDWELEEATSPEQALLYRLSGDPNPLHADPAFAERVGFAKGPILHGLCTFGYTGRAALLRACEGDPARLMGLGAQFRRPVWPGDTLLTRGYRTPQGDDSSGRTRWVLDTRVKERDEAVLGGAYADVAPPETDDESAATPPTRRRRAPMATKDAKARDDEDDDREDEEDDDPDAGVPVPPGKVAKQAPGKHVARSEAARVSSPSPRATKSSGKAGHDKHSHGGHAKDAHGGGGVDDEAQDPSWWVPYAVLGAIVVVGVLGFFGAFSSLLKPLFSPPKLAAETHEEALPSKPAEPTPATPAKGPPGAPSGAADAETFGAKHLLVMYKDSRRAPPTITRSKEEALARAKEALAKAKGPGAKFEDLVTEYSDEPGAGKRGGNLGNFRRGAMVKEFQDALDKMKVGDLSDVVETPFGYHVIQRTK